MSTRRLSSALTLLALLGACDPAQPANPAATRPLGADLSHARPDLISASAQAPGGITKFIAAELARAQAQHVELVVYVGATWCEPCRYFHEALLSGALDKELVGVRFLEFDFDRDHAALSGAGYQSKLIPLFTVPKADGTASDRHIEGSVKGPNAVTENLLPRLKTLLSKR